MMPTLLYAISNVTIWFLFSNVALDLRLSLAGKFFFLLFIFFFFFFVCLLQQTASSPAAAIMKFNPSKAPPRFNSLCAFPPSVFFHENLDLVLSLFSLPAPSVFLQNFVTFPASFVTHILLFFLLAEWVSFCVLQLVFSFSSSCWSFPFFPLFLCEYVLLSYA